MKFIQDFKAFALKGNVIDMAVGVIIGKAFGDIVNSVVNNIIMPPVGLLIGGTDFSKLAIKLKDAVPAVMKDGEEVEAAKDAVMLNYGQFIQDVLNFFILALCIFMMVKFITKLTAKKKTEEPAAPAPEPEPSNEEKLLGEIRDLLKEKK